MTVLETFEMTGSVAVVTGGASGLGRAFSEAMAEAGADVVVADVDVDGARSVAADLESETDAETLPLEVDVTEEDAVESMFEEAVDRFGRVDAVFANAGIGAPEAPLEDYEMEQWDRVIDVNLRGVWLTDLYAARVMVDQESGGAIVNTASVYGLRGMGTLPYSPAYSASKGAVVNLTRTLGGEWGQHDIRVNAIAPSHSRTNIGDGFLKEDAPGMEELQEAIRSQTPLGRISDPEEVKGLALFLASKASSYCTGYTYAVDGGWLAH